MTMSILDQAVCLSRRPWLQRCIAHAWLTPNYRLLPSVRIHWEEQVPLPASPVIFAMNHTDFYNYWPFQYELARRHGRHTAAWVKGKYFEHPALAWFLRHTNNIPAVSKGYLIAKDFAETMGRKPTSDEFDALQRLVAALWNARGLAVGGHRDPQGESDPQGAVDAVDAGETEHAVEARDGSVKGGSLSQTTGPHQQRVDVHDPRDATGDEEEALAQATHVARAVPSCMLGMPRARWGVSFDPGREHYAAWILRVYGQAMQRFVDVHQDAHARGIDVLLFPQGTRSKRLLPGLPGVAQLALHGGWTVIPVGCNGSDQLYPGSFPWAKRGEVRYRLGEAIDARRWAERHQIPSFAPFSPETDMHLRPHFEALVNEITQRIDALLDAPYRLDEATSTKTVRDIDRFI